MHAFPLPPSAFPLPPSPSTKTHSALALTHYVVVEFSFNHPHSPKQTRLNTTPHAEPCAPIHYQTLVRLSAAASQRSKHPLLSACLSETVPATAQPTNTKTICRTTNNQRLLRSIRSTIVSSHSGCQHRTDMRPSALSPRPHTHTHTYGVVSYKSACRPRAVIAANGIKARRPQTTACSSSLSSSALSAGQKLRLYSPPAPLERAATLSTVEGGWKLLFASLPMQ